MTDNHDKIYIRDLGLRCIIGINPEERKEKQTVLINVTLHCNLEKAGKTDDINNTIDYKSLKQGILALVEGSSFFLIEALAQNIAELCLRQEGVAEAKVTVDKPGALRYARSVAVEICRKKRAKVKS
jgi:dihydroneopterin aldolase/D-erythro-7,8-dihydroneopterin triphosphate epimerase